MEVTHSAISHEEKGKLYLAEPNAKEFLIKKGQRFDVTQVGDEGGCTVRVQKRSFELTSCPWLDGFVDHQAETFQVVSSDGASDLQP